MSMRYVSRSLGLEYLEIAKSACSSIKVALLKSDKVSGNIIEHVHTNHHFRDVPDTVNVGEVFTMVRHPFERLISSWRQKLQTGLAKQLCGRMPLPSTASFVEWTLWVTSENYSGCDKHWLPQTEMLARHAKRGDLPDWIGRVDRGDWQDLQLRYLNLPDLTHENVSKKERLEPEWTAESWWAACRFYANDLARFGYSAESYRPLGATIIPVVQATFSRDNIQQVKASRTSVVRDLAPTRSDDEEWFATVSHIGGWMFKNEMLWLRHRARDRDRIVEVGVWKGRSLFALASGACGTVVGVDHWLGSPDEQATTHKKLATETGQNTVYEAAVANMRPFLDSGVAKLLKMESTQAAETWERAEEPDIDMFFLDSGHDYDSAKADLAAWEDRVKIGGLFCGHDYKQHLGCYRAVNERFGADKIKRGAGSIWFLIKE